MSTLIWIQRAARLATAHTLGLHLLRRQPVNRIDGARRRCLIPGNLADLAPVKSGYPIWRCRGCRRRRWPASYRVLFVRANTEWRGVSGPSSSPW